MLDPVVAVAVSDGCFCSRQIPHLNSMAAENAAVEEVLADNLDTVWHCLQQGICGMCYSISPGLKLSTDNIQLTIN